MPINRLAKPNRASLRRGDPLARGLVLGMPFTEGSGGPRDYSGFGNHGTLQGNPQWVSSLFGPALDFDGAGDYIDIGANDLATGSQDRTFVAWIKPSTVDGEYLCSLGNTAANASESWRFWIGRAAEESSSLRIEIEGSGYTTSLQPPADQWSFVGCRLKGTTLSDHTVFLNTTSEQASGTATLNTQSDVAVIGIKTDLTAEPFTGLFANAMFWRRALLDAEIRALYADPFRLFRRPSGTALYAAATATGGTTVVPLMHHRHKTGSAA